MGTSVKQREKFVVGRDTEWGEISRANKKGNELVFSLELDDFKVLKSEELKELTKTNIINYMIAREACRKVEESDGDPPLPAFSIDPEAVMSSTQLDVVKKKKGMHYCWKRPENTSRALALGYKIVDASKVGVFNSHKSVGIVGTADKTELVLMEIPQEKADAIVEAAVKESKRRDGAVEETAIDDMNAQGVTGVRVKGD